MRLMRFRDQFGNIHEASLLRGAKGSKGDKGDKGDRGEKGDKGDPGSGEEPEEITNEEIEEMMSD